MTLSVALVTPYGEPRAAFFPEALLGWLCARARAAGHRAAMARVFYEGDPAGDRAIAARLEAWLGAQGADLVVFERLFDPDPVRAHCARAPGRTSLLVTRGDSVDPAVAVDLVLGATPGRVRGGDTRRSPSVDELVHGFDELLARLAAGDDPLGAPGVARWDGERLVPGAEAALEPPEVPFEPELDAFVIARGRAPLPADHTLFGNAGCPYGADPATAPLLAGLRLPVEPPIAARGCAFCAMGGDYQKRPDAKVVERLLEQARWYVDHAPALERLVLSDQHGLRYLGALLRAMTGAGLGAQRLVFAARADAFLRETDRVEDAIAAAAEGGHALELYLTGFESFSDTELSRYHKGVDAARLVEAVQRMRALAAAHPSFSYREARGHSLIPWNPWTRPEDLAESVAVIREHGLAELFDDLGRNRLRLYPDLPLFAAAERDGALVDEWPAGGGGAGRAKGYNVERPWRFLDARTHAAHEIAELLRARLGRQTEAAQLAAAAACALAAPSDAAACVAAGLEALASAFGELLDPSRAAGAPARGATERASVVRFAGHCDLSCASCDQRTRFLPDDLASVSARVAAARARPGPIVLAGREPLAHPDVLALIALARGEDGRRVGVVAHGGSLADPRRADQAIRVGLSAISLKLLGPDADLADRIAGRSGSHAASLRAASRLRAAGIEAVEVRAGLHRDTLARFHEHARLAVDVGADQLRVEADLHAIGLLALEDAARSLRSVAAAAAAAHLPLEVSPLEAGPSFFERIPCRPPRDGSAGSGNPTGH